MKAKPTAKVKHTPDPAAMMERCLRYAYENRVVVGVPANADDYGDGTPQVLVAAVHEFGAPSVGVPERSYLRVTIRRHRDEYKRLIRANLRKVGNGQMTQEQSLGQLGEMAKGHVQAFIASNPYRLKAATIKRKGSSRALINTGHLRQSIQWGIEPDDAKGSTVK